LQARSKDCFPLNTSCGRGRSLSLRHRLSRARGR
jgi:hypothetical protein